MSTHLEETVPPWPPRTRLDSANHFGVGLDTKLVFSFVDRGISSIGEDGCARIALDREEAINLAAWIQVLVDPDGSETARVIAEIRKKL